MTAIFDSDVDVKIGFAFGHGPLDATPVFTDVSNKVRGVETSRGAATPLAKFEAGTGAIRLANETGEFDPNNTASTHSPNVLVNVPVRVQAINSGTTHTLFRGVVKAWPVSYTDIGKFSHVDVPIVDDFQTLSLRRLSDKTYTQKDVGARIAEVLDDIGWPAGRRDLDTGLSLAAEFVATSNVAALTHMQQLVDGEAGALFMSAAGDVVFRNRVNFAGGLSPAATFGPGSTELNYRAVTPAYDSKFLWNDVRVTRAGGTEQIATSTGSIDKFGQRTLTRASLNSDDSEALNVAEWLRDKYDDVQVRVESLQVRPRDRTGPDLWPTVLGTDFDDSLTVKIDPPGAGDTLNQDVAAQGVRHTFTPLAWDTKFLTRTLTTRETDGYWIVGTSTLDVGTRLA